MMLFCFQLVQLKSGFRNIFIYIYHFYFQLFPLSSSQDKVKAFVPTIAIRYTQKTTGEMKTIMLLLSKERKIDVSSFMCGLLNVTKAHFT